jgi:heme A synthase
VEQKELYEFAHRMVGIAVFLLLGNLPLVLVIKRTTFRNRKRLCAFVLFYWIILALIFYWIYPSLLAG